MQAPLLVLDGATTGLDVTDPESEVFPPGFDPMTIDQAVRAITIDAAWQLRMEDKVGSLEVGKHADFAVLDADPYEAKPGTAHKIDVLMTMMDGRFTHRAD